MKFYRVSFLEFFIVVTVLAVLSCIMILISSEAAGSIQSGSIISALRNISLNAKALRSASPDITETDLKNYVIPYMTSKPIPEMAQVFIKNNNGSWWAGYSFDNEAGTPKLKAKISLRAHSLNLKGSNSPSIYPSASSPDYSDEAVIWLQIY